MQFPSATAAPGGSIVCDDPVKKARFSKRKEEPKNLRYVHAAVDAPRHPQTREAARRLRQRAKHELPTQANAV